MNTKRFSSSAFECGKKYFRMLFTVAALVGLSFGQAIPGTLTSTATTSHPINCETGTVTNYVWTFTDPSGAEHLFSGETTRSITYTKIAGVGCEAYHLITSLDEWSTDGRYYLEATGASGTVTAEAGYVDPKYLVVGVTYAPPGPSPNTWVEYQNSTFVGTTESLSHSFSSSNTQSVSLTYGSSIPGFGSGTFKDTYSTTNSVTTKATSTVSSSINVQSGEKTFGTGSYFAPVDHDYDLIWVWLNPVAIFSIYAGTPLPVWNGYGYDTTDQNQMDIVPIALGYLNGDFGAIPPDTQTSFNRAWAADQMWPSGQGAALTSADLAQIASADPFSVSTYGPDYISYDPPSPSTSDYRFTVSLCTGSSSFNASSAESVGGLGFGESS
jgi:hypothetical protein